ncbi:MAG: hypothetical protein AAF772_01150 [Acidobacteriota bacterium]
MAAVRTRTFVEIVTRATEKSPDLLFRRGLCDQLDRALREIDTRSLGE